MAHQGFDSITIDMQHGLIDYQMAVTMLQAISTTTVIPLVRVPWNDPARLMKALDAGAYGVICPMVNTVADAIALVRACKYPPLGIRSFGPIRAKYYAGGGTHGGGEYHIDANEVTLVIPQIETREAIENLEGILGVEGIGGIYVGPSDLAMALGSEPRKGQNDPVVIEARRSILETCKRHGIPAGIHTNSVGVAVEMIKQGFQLTSLQSDDRFLMSRANEEVTAVRSALGGGAS